MAMASEPTGLHGVGEPNRRSWWALDNPFRVSSMRFITISISALAFVTLLAFGVSSAIDTPKDAKQESDEVSSSPLTREEKIREMMDQHLKIRPVIQRIARTRTPYARDDEDWQALVGAGVLISKSGERLADLAPDALGKEDLETWLRNAATLHENGTDLKKFAGSKKFDKARRAVAIIRRACISCHEKHRTNKP